MSTPTPQISHVLTHENIVAAATLLDSVGSHGIKIPSTFVHGPRAAVDELPSPSVDVGILHEARHVVPRHEAVHVHPLDPGERPLHARLSQTVDERIEPVAPRRRDP